MMGPGRDAMHIHLWHRIFPWIVDCRKLQFCGEYELTMEVLG